MSASLNCIAWCEANGFPKVLRSKAYFTDISKQPSASDNPSVATEIRPHSRVFKNARKPDPSCPSKLSRGTRTLSKICSRVSTPCQPIFLYRRPTVYPGVPWGMISEQYCPLPSASLPEALTATRPWPIRVPALEIKHFVPFTTHSSPSKRDVVWIFDASDPACASVKPKAPSRSPRASGANHLCFCSSVPKCRNGNEPIVKWACKVVAID